MPHYENNIDRMIDGCVLDRWCCKERRRALIERRYDDLWGLVENDLTNNSLAPHNLAVFFNFNREGNSCGDFQVSTKFPSGSTGTFGFSFFFVDGHAEQDLTLNVFFVVSRKRKHRWKGDLTGEDGLAPLLFAKYCLKLLESYPKWVGCKRVRIEIRWSDSKRRRLYEKLLEYGYKKQQIEGEWCLVKNIWPEKSWSLKQL